MHDQLRHYLEQFALGTISSGDMAELKRLAADPANEPVIHSFIDDQLEHAKEASHALDGAIGQQFLADINRLISEEQIAARPVRPVHRVHFLKKWWWAAAAILVVGASIAVVVSSDRQPKSSDLAGNELTSDILPGGDHAVLTLADGSTITLDSAAAGQLANQGGVKVMKLADGQLSYDLRGLNSKEVMWNTMSTPRGGQYQVTLPDGTKVWLNAASSITFPTAFIGQERKVKITGEVYMEVAKNKAKPFFVDVNGRSTVQVLGTSFNINSYGDEENIKTTLIEGSVKVLGNTSAVAASSRQTGTSPDRQPKPSGTDGVILKPGQQALQPLHTSAVAASSDRQLKVSSANIEQTLAWKNGIFNFKNTDLPAIMKQIERWYDVEVKYEGSVPALQIGGKMDRGVKLSGIMRFLAEYGVRTRLEGRNLIIEAQ